MARTPELLDQGEGRGGGGGGGQRALLPPNHPHWPAALAGYLPHTALAPEGDTEARSRRGSRILGGPEEKTRSRRGPRHGRAEHQHRPGGAPADPPSALHQSPVRPHTPWEGSQGVEQEGDMYILSYDCESEPEAGCPAPAPSSPVVGSRAAPGPVLAKAESRSWAS